MHKALMQRVRLVASMLVCMIGWAHAADQSTALSCEQVYAIAQATLAYRDKGHTLDQVLGLLKSTQAQGKLTALELETLRRAITSAYLGYASPEEIALECLRTKGGRG